MSFKKLIQHVLPLGSSEVLAAGRRKRRVPDIATFCALQHFMINSLALRLQLLDSAAGRNTETGVNA
ncbi:hypothetical protein [Roseateles albus]|uniref:hypothetical protein n=1 Tax=Roseateles albus TaxID=2987525 RepID=UPI002359814F|nr:hypothetical protein [Roseateles albus]